MAQGWRPSLWYANGPSQRLVPLGVKDDLGAENCGPWRHRTFPTSVSCCPSALVLFVHGHWRPTRLPSNDLVCLSSSTGHINCLSSVGTTTSVRNRVLSMCDCHLVFFEEALSEQTRDTRQHPFFPLFFGLLSSLHLDPAFQLLAKQSILLSTFSSPPCCCPPSLRCDRSG